MEAGTLQAARRGDRDLGAEDSESTIHAWNESIDLADRERMIQAEALLFEALGSGAPAS